MSICTKKRCLLCSRLCACTTLRLDNLSLDGALYFGICFHNHGSCNCILIIIHLMKGHIVLYFRKYRAYYYARN